MSKLQFKIAQAQEELLKVCQVRYKVYCEEVGIFDPAEYPDGIMRDEYDDRSINFYSQNQEGEMISVVRLIKHHPVKPFPAQKNSYIPPEYCGPDAVEISRAGTLKKFQRRMLATFGLFDFLFEYCKQQSYGYIIAIAGEKMLGIYKKLEIPFVYVGEPFDYRGFKSFPLAYEVKPDFHIIKKKY
jgi:N-acyl-L-homoserine lactone synthetase